MKISLFFAMSCIIVNFSATSSCFPGNANKDRKINDGRKLNVMQNYIQKQMYSQEYDSGIQAKENNFKSYAKNKNKTELSRPNVGGSEVQIAEMVGNINNSDKMNKGLFNMTTYNVPDM